MYPNDNGRPSARTTRQMVTPGVVSHVIACRDDVFLILLLQISLTIWLDSGRTVGAKTALLACPTLTVYSTLPFRSGTRKSVSIPTASAS